MQKKKYFELVLYTTGTTPRSEQAINKLKDILEKNFKGRYKLKLVDIIKNPKLAESNNIIATPLIERKLPPPLKRILGDLNDKDDILIGLGLKEFSEQQK